MAVTSNSFSAAVDAWVRQTEDRMERVFKGSCQRLVSEAQTPVGAGGNMPIDTGFLRSSGIATTDSPTPMNPAHTPDKDKKYTFSMGSAEGVIAGLKIGMTLYFTWTAIYARVVEYGGPGRAGRGFVRLAAQKWQSIVAQVTQEAKSRAGQ